MIAASHQQPRQLELLRREVVKVHNVKGYCTIEGARETTKGYAIKVRMCGKYAHITFECRPQEIIELPVKLQMIERHYP